jgi:4a-hydroxytetrahydrobiopterin dehydratase
MEKKLANQKCVPCEGGMPPMSLEGIKKNIVKIDGWTHKENTIVKVFELLNFQEAVSFVNKISELSENEGHHPDIRIFSYKKVEITLSTHAVGGLSVNDFILAAKIDNLKLS